VNLLNYTASKISKLAQAVALPIMTYLNVSL